MAPFVDSYGVLHPREDIVDVPVGVGKYFRMLRLDASGTEADLAKMNRIALLRYAEEHGIDVDKNDRVDNIREAIAAAM